MSSFFLGAVSVIALPFVLLAIFSFTHYLKSWYKSQCPVCDGKKGHHSLLLIFASDDWMTCSRCKGTGKFYV